MYGTLQHSPSEIVLKLLRDLEISTTASWPATADSEASSPDNVLTVYWTTGRIHGKSQLTGRLHEDFGIQIRARGKVPIDAKRKILSIQEELERRTVEREVTVGTTTYIVNCMTQSGSTALFGKDGGVAVGRNICTVNYLLTVTAPDYGLLYLGMPDGQFIGLPDGSPILVP